MLPNTKRLSTKQFEEVLKKGRVVHNPLFWLRFFEANKVVSKSASKVTPITKVAVICPQKVAKSAVARNKIRRTVYDQVGVFVDQLSAGYDCIVCAKEPYTKATDAESIEQLRNIFVKAGLLK